MDQTLNLREFSIKFAILVYKYFLLFFTKLFNGLLLLLLFPISDLSLFLFFLQFGNFFDKLSISIGQTIAYLLQLVNFKLKYYFFLTLRFIIEQFIDFFIIDILVIDFITIIRLLSSF